MKKAIGVERLLWKNFWGMILLVFVGIAVPYFMIVGLSNYYENYKYNVIQTAKERITDDYTMIPKQDVLEHNGSMAIVKGDLSVISLIGEPIFDKEKLTKEEWSDFLVRSGKLDIVEYDIAYHAEKDFWLVIATPVALTIRIDYAANADSPENANIMKWMLLVFFCYFAVIGLSAFIYAKLIAKRLTLPIKNLNFSAAAIGKGDYVQCEVDSNITELAKLQMGINHLSNELKQHEKNRDIMEEQRRHLVMEISHDLKNPLASIQGYSELLMHQFTNQKVLTEDKKEIYLGLIHSNAIRANELLSSLFTYSQLESQAFSLQLERTNICEYVRLIIGGFISIIEEKHFRLEADIPETDCECLIDRQMFHRVLDNLIWNTLKYNLPGTEIVIRMQRVEQEVEILFGDNGKGIPKEDIESIFLPFSRTDADVRNSKEGGSGLGLAIVKKILTLHGGTVELKSDINQGCTFIMRIPTI